VVAFLPDGQRLVGQPARAQQITNPSATIYAAKRLIGRRFEDLSEKFKSNLSYKVVRGPNGDAWVDVRGTPMSPSEVGAEVLKKMKKTAEDKLGKAVNKAVITVPAYFNDSQRQATKDAGKIAGFQVERIINEPTAAALAYGLKVSKGQTVAVYDLGGGTFDVSVLEMGDGVFEVRATSGDTFLGGEDFDIAVMKWVIDEFKKKENVDLTKDAMAVARIREAAEKAKCELSSLQETEINLPFICQHNGAPKHLQTKLSRAKLEQLCQTFIDRTIDPCKNALRDAKLTTKQIDEVILVGGMTRMPKVQEVCKNFFGKQPYKGVNPDEAVAMGAAVQGAIIRGNPEFKNLILLDVTPLSLGIETLGGVFTKLIPRNTTVPVKKSQIFSTAADHQTEVQVKVYQGEREMAADNHLLGLFSLQGIPPAPKGVPQIEVTFDIDVNGVVNVSARDVATSAQQNIRIQSKGGLSEAQIKKMLEESERNKVKDAERKTRIEARNKLDSVMAEIEKNIETHKEKLPGDEVDSMKEEIKTVRESAGGDKATVDEINSAVTNLQSKSLKLFSNVYKNAGAGGGASSSGSTSS
jgi:molecular chaperone DnaK